LRTTVDINSSGGKASVPITLLIAQAPTMVLTPSGIQFTAPAGSAPGNTSGVAAVLRQFGQVNAQIPFELDSAKAYQVIVQANGAVTALDTIQLQPAVPGLAAR
jgi:hypothetical protein